MSLVAFFPHLVECTADLRKCFKDLFICVGLAYAFNSSMNSLHKERNGLCSMTYLLHHVDFIHFHPTHSTHWCTENLVKEEEEEKEDGSNSVLGLRAQADQHWNWAVTSLFMQG
ncbi:uncharacterized protein LOC132176990 isoform X2 [Corylus avellana]|uniref:uncharacterized protein LOC132176990 isoform X2 n=1 Tax=Corylus avellana TaxID=13451 RepID=UPI00286B0A45|nr:uncharacterized protein LOC132176990 isoform X2 [Corylus avellana]